MPFVFELTAAGLAMVAAVRHVGKAHSVGAKLSEGKKKMTGTLKLCREEGKDFEPSDAEYIGQTFKKLRTDEKEIEAENRFPNCLNPTVIIAARRYASAAGSLLEQTQSISEKAQAKVVPFLRQPRVIQNEASERNRHDLADPANSQNMDSRSIDVVLEAQTDDAVEQNVPSETSSLHLGEDNNSFRLRLRGQNWTVAGALEPLPAIVNLSPIS